MGHVDARPDCPDQARKDCIVATYDIDDEPMVSSPIPLSLRSSFSSLRSTAGVTSVFTAICFPSHLKIVMTLGRYIGDGRFRDQAAEHRDEPGQSYDECPGMGRRDRSPIPASL